MTADGHDVGEAPTRRTSNDDLDPGRLAKAALATLAPRLVPVNFPPGACLYAPGEKVRAVDFLETGWVRLTTPFGGGGASAQLLGAHRAVGLLPALSGLAAAESAYAITPVTALRIEANALQQAFSSIPALAQALLAEVAEQIAELHVEVGCGSRHSAEQRLAGMLLTLHRARPGEPLRLIHGQLAAMLGVQRTTVTAIAHRLKKTGCVAYMRGRIRILNERRLAAVACACRQQPHPTSGLPVPPEPIGSVAGTLTAKPSTP